MANQSQALSVFNFKSNAIRVITDDKGEPWFLAHDVCNVLGYQNTSLTISKHCRASGVSKRYTTSEKGVLKQDTPTECDVSKRDTSSRARESQEMTYINEGNLYRLIIKSRKPEAEPFESWVCDEVLPSIRKTGSYTVPRAVISPEQKAALFAIVAKRAGDNGKIRAQLWARHNKHFRIAKYEELLAIHFDEAVRYLETLELSTPRPEALPAPSKECQQAMNLVNSMQDLSLLSGTVNYDQVRDGLRHLLIHLGQHQPYAQVKPAVTVLEATERMLCRLWTMIDESSFRVGMLQNIGKSGRPLTDGNIETIGNINSILSRKMMHVELPVI